ncbi:ABC transporter permease [Catalinimonas niigatensis]|uniref:ABC transporter permease n=1 Tax=Catalinimonas niigatensis TaxID=1397264 RepID=UPI0026658405|nr:ABC transporter permease [Catalinimonas niigatensis]WPP50330.1 ABC transporter permease [Catalinimonas niigatensis]
MFRNYFKISTRNLLRHKLFTTINVLGLAIGLSSFLLISEYLRFEDSYDSFFSDSEQIHRLSIHQIINGEVVTKEATMYYPAGKALKDELPEVEEYTTTRKFSRLIFRHGESVVQEDHVVTADTNFLKLFDYQVLQGSADEMFDEPNSLVLTQSKARFYFGDQNPLGETLEVLGHFNRSFKITGVIEDVPENTQYKFDILLSDETIKDRFDYNNWDLSNYYSFVKLVPQASLSAVSGKLENLSKKYLSEGSMEFFYLIPVQDIHLKSDFQYEAEIPGSEKAVSFMRIIAFFILIIAWINYINLSTARAINRAKEVGLRKVIGAYKLQIINQFLLEALLVNFIAAILALLISELLLPFFHQLIGKEIVNHVWNHLPFLQSLLIFFIIGTLVSGFYPALVLSGFKPVAVLKGKFRNSKSGTLLRKGLVVVQFTASIVLIAGTFTVYHQLQFMQGKDLGFSTDHVVGFYLPDVGGEQWNAHQSKVASFKEALRKHVAVETVGGTSHLPGGEDGEINYTTTKTRIVGLTDLRAGATYWQNIDEHFLETLNMELLAGRNFDPTRIADTMVVMANQAFLRKFNIDNAESVLHKEIQIGEEEGSDKFQIIGIIKDFNRTSLKSDVEPSLYFPSYQSYATVVKLNPKQYQEGLAYLSDTWNEFFPDTPLDYTFLDDRFAALYEQDRRFGEIFGTFSALAIFIATLGLFGLSSFMAVQRTVEVGVRKVLGASVPNIIGIFYKDFLILLSFAGLIGLPAVYFSMNFWLENYAYRIDFPWLLSIAALCIVVVFALLTVGYQIYKVAILDPARTLKYE